jgi:hypothetical protein
VPEDKQQQLEQRQATKPEQRQETQPEQQLEQRQETQPEQQLEQQQETLPEQQQCLGMCSGSQSIRYETFWAIRSYFLEIRYRTVIFFSTFIL